MELLSQLPFLDCSFLVYRTIIAFVYWSCTLKLSYISLLAVVARFPVDSLGIFLHRRSSHSWVEIVLLFLFNMDGFCSFSSLIALVRTSRTMLESSREREHSCLASDLRGSACSLSLLCIFWPKVFQTYLRNQLFILGNTFTDKLICGMRLQYLTIRIKILMLRETHAI